MFTEVIALIATKKVIGLAVAAGLAASATVAGTFGTSGSTSAPFPSLAPVVVEADLGSMLRFGHGSEAGAVVATDTQADLGVPTAAGGTTLGGVLEIPQATSGVTATAEAEASTTADVQTTATAEAALEAEVALDGLADVEAGGLLSVSLR